MSRHWKEPDKPYYVERTDTEDGQTLYQAHLRDGSFSTFQYGERETAVIEVLNYIDKLKKGQ